MFLKKEKVSDLKKIYRKIIIFFMGLTATGSFSAYSKNKDNCENDLIKILKKELE